MTKFQSALMMALAAFASACSGQHTGDAQKNLQISQAPRPALCETSKARVLIDYPAARVNGCQILSETSFVFTITPEKETDPQGVIINNSPWYGFQIVPKGLSALQVRLEYEGGSHRYLPKISYDGKTWDLLPPSRVQKTSKTQIDLQLAADTRPFYISAQEIYTKTAHDLWTTKLAERPSIARSTIGSSRDGHPIYMLDIQTQPSTKKPYVILVGRQHPPEVTGALALAPFSETVLGDSPLAKRFRAAFNVMIIPMINPDGVTEGNWRFNKGGTDLNRDWGPFTQPETQAVRKALDPFIEGEKSVAFFLDFHSTWRNLMYTQADDEPTSPPMFAKEWLEAVDAKLDDDVYPFTREARHNSGKPTSKNYMYETFGISAITYEVGDQADRKAIGPAARVFAAEMMRLLLQHQGG